MFYGVSWSECFTMTQAQGRHDVIYEEYRRAQAQLEKVEAYSAKIAEEMDKLNAMETDENRE